MPRGTQSQDSASDPPRLRRIPPRHILRALGSTLKADIWKNKTRLWTFFIVTILLASFLVGLVYYWAEQDGDKEDFVEIYLTDLPANFTSVDVILAAVYVGADNHSLLLEQPTFDLLRHRGPEGALRVASGHVPRGGHDEIRVAFQSVHVTLNGESLRLDLPQPVLVIGHALGLGEVSDASAFLLDINLDDSIVATESGLAFHPTVQGLYIHHYGEQNRPLAAGASQAAQETRPPFIDVEARSPDREALEKEQPRSENPFTSAFGRPSNSAPPTSSRFSWNPPPPTSSSASENPSETPPLQSPTDTSSALPTPGDINSVPDDPDEPGGWFVRFLPSEEDQAALVALVESVRAEVVFMFGSTPAAYIFATPAEAKALSELPGVLYVEADQAVVLNMQSSTHAVRLPEVQNPLFGPKDANGAALDGRGIGVAIIDLGFDGTHPDLRHRLVSSEPAFALNFKIESLFTADLVNTDQTSGHGTHVAGIVGGRGIGDPTLRGVAHKSTLYGFAIGEMSTTLWPNVALDWLVQNHDQVNPPIRVVTNSWGSGSSYDPNSLTTRLVEQLVDEGVIVVFAAGNAGGDGSTAATTSQCQIPKEGVVCVAAFDDLNLGQRDGKIAPYSSRGRLQAPQTWPDLSAPGTDIRSARPLLGSTTGFGLVPYTTMSGTSMAAPHVAGAVALMVQANPGLSPAQVEQILEASVYKFSEGGSYITSADPRFNGSHHAKGHGLLDVYAAVQVAKAA